MVGDITETSPEPQKGSLARKILEKAGMLKPASEARPVIRRPTVGFASHVGRVRSLDEDSIIMLEVSTALESQRRRRMLLVMADGMGGHSKGEVASYVGSMAVAGRALPSMIAKEEEDFSKILVDAIKEANRAILDYASKSPGCEGMGTTMTAAIMDGERLFIGHVGDSRAYVVDEKETIQITKDHSYVQELIDLGLIKPEEARSHPQRNIITRVVGYYGDVDVDAFSLLLKPDDYVLLCCDGLTLYVTEDEIREAVLSSGEAQEACEKLVALANERGGSDNISVAIAPVRKAWA